jgi:hypothetical protein
MIYNACWGKERSGTILEFGFGAGLMGISIPCTSRRWSINTRGRTRFFAYFAVVVGVIYIRYIVIAKQFRTIQESVESIFGVYFRVITISSFIVEFHHTYSHAVLLGSSTSTIKFGSYFGRRNIIRRLLRRCLLEFSC